MLSATEIEGILEEVRGGNRDAFRLIIRHYNLSLRSLIASQVHHLEDVDDLGQEVFITAYRNLGAFRRGEDFGAWLKGIARNKLSDFFRSSARRHRAMDRVREELRVALASEFLREEPEDDGVAIEALLRCIGRLPERLRRVVRAGLDGDKSAAIAKELVTSVGAVYNLHYRANQLLRECVRKELG